MHQTSTEQYFGVDAVRAKSDALTITVVPKWGSNLISIRHNATDYPILREPESLQQYEERPMLYGTPVLFPPNRLADGKLHFRDRTYDFDLTEPDRNNHIHGLVHNQPFRLVSHKADDHGAEIITEYRSAEDGYAMRQFPHDFRLRLIYRLQNAALTVTAEVENLGAEAFPWGLGYHTTFTHETGEDSFKLTVDKKWELDATRLLPTEKWEDFDAAKWQEGFSLKNVALDDAFYNGQAKERNQMVLDSKKAPVQITYGADENFLHWVIYTGTGDLGFVCPEPYTWITNAPNLKIGEGVTGVQVLQPSEKKAVSTTIQIADK
ncbi:aldose 1-epimerase [Aureibacillus halotolerans]|uniref:Aldose 1-epimerase n=1 Tax=Aureibacillus halotolerans TaxID=1508390 RepID=A0A4R6TS51_9BACI|nr:aldose 1-epimerase [Aureibacillus halotolerans]TDQ36430.1 aldose 1-epimerase [Aureibacillus halotolerans]